MEDRNDSDNIDPMGSLVRHFLCERSPAFRELTEVRARGWANKEGDKYFKRQRQSADYANNTTRRLFFGMMRQIGDELQLATNALSLPGPSPKVLDLCMAPGGYAASTLKHSPHAHVSGITLPEDQGGHQLLVNHGSKDPRVEVTSLDITMLSSEFGVEDNDIPADHPDKHNFLPAQRPYLGQSFDLTFCDGQVLRTHARPTYRERNEASRLTCAQLILALQRICLGGTIIILLHKIEAWDTLKLLFQFNSFASIRLFKPKKFHALRSSFYLVATDVDPQHEVAKSALEGWKQDWKDATFAYANDGEETNVQKMRSGNAGEVSHVLTEFGTRLVELGDPIWAIQRDALSGASFT